MLWKKATLLGLAGFALGVLIGIGFTLAGSSGGLKEALPHLLMGGIGALDERDRLSEHGGVALEDALHVVGHRHLSAGKTLAVEVGIDLCRLLHTAVDREALIFF